MPPLTPVTTPEASTVATPVALLLQLPPLVASLKVDVAPWQNVVVPVIDAGAAGTVFTVIPEVVIAVPQLLVTVYVIVAEPAVTP